MGARCGFLYRVTWMGSDGAHRWSSSSIPISNATPTTLFTKLHLISACLSSPSRERVNTKGMSLFPRSRRYTNTIPGRWCWPGSSSWIDFFNPKSWDMWVKLFKTQSIDGSWSWTQSSENVAIWNDMNEVRDPSWSRRHHVTDPSCSHRYSTAPRSRCRGITYIMVDGSTEMCITSMACFLYVLPLIRWVFLTALVTPSIRPTKLTMLSITALTLPNVPSCSPVPTMLVPNALQRYGLVTTWVHGNTWQ